MQPQVLMALIAGLVACLAIAGCAHTAGQISEEAAEEATPAVIEQSLAELNEPATRRQIVRLFSAPEIEEATERLTGNVTDGALSALSEPERAERISGAAHAFTSEVSAAIATAFRERIGPEIYRAAGQILDRH